MTSSVEKGTRKCRGREKNTLAQKAARHVLRGRADDTESASVCDGLVDDVWKNKGQSLIFREPSKDGIVSGQCDP